MTLADINTITHVESRLKRLWFYSFRRARATQKMRRKASWISWDKHQFWRYYFRIMTRIMNIIFTAFLAFQWGIFNKEINKLNPAVLKIKGHTFGHRHHLHFLYLFNRRNQLRCSVVHYASCICQPLLIFPKIRSLCRSTGVEFMKKIENVIANCIVSFSAVHETLNAEQVIHHCFVLL